MDFDAPALTWIPSIARQPADLDLRPPESNQVISEG